MNTSAVITGLGLITPLACGVQANWQALLAGRSLRDHGKIQPTLPVADAPDRVSALALIAARQAIQSAPNFLQDSDPASTSSRCALIVGTSKGPIDQWLADHARSFLTNIATSDNEKGGELHFSPFKPNLGLHTISQWLDRQLPLAQGPRLTISAACASGLIALIRGVMMLRSNQADRVLVVAAESSLHPIFLASFKRLGVLSPPDQLLRPLDVRRNGFFISEAAAAICLERRQARPTELVIDRFAQGGDAYHLTGADPSGRIQRYCLTRAIDGRPVDLVHAHATGTQLNDPIELAAIDASLAGISPTARPGRRADLPLVYAHKAAIGHTLGASGLVSLVLNCLMHKHGCVAGNINTDQPLQVENLQIGCQAITRPILRSVAIASGFGGATAAVSLRTT